MSGLDSGALIAVAALGALHGINPGMGWLFAVALGLQEKKGRAVWRALPPLAVGHAVSVGLFVAVASVLGLALDGTTLRILVGVALLLFALHRVLRGHRHVRYGGMRVNQRELAIWSFLMATAHGAGLMLLPFTVGGGAHAAHAHGAATLLAAQPPALVAAVLHTVTYFATAGVIAVVVYERAGIRLLRTAWINLDIVWAAALVVTALAVLLPLL